MSRARGIAIRGEHSMASQSMPLHSRVVPGLLVAAVGVILTLHNLNLIRIQGIWRFWPLILIGFGISHVISSNPKNRGFGIALLVAGSFFQLANLGLISVRLRDLWRFWPLILIVVGVGQLLGQHRPRNLTGGLILLGLGVYFQLAALDLIEFDLWRLWPIILIIIGIGMVQKALQSRSLSR